MNPVTAHTQVIPKMLFKITQTVVFGIQRSFSRSRTVNWRPPSIASRTRSILSNVFVVEGRPERESLSTEVISFFWVEKKIWCKFVDLVFQSFLTITKAAELKNSFVNKDTLRINYTCGWCQQATDRFVRRYCWRSCPAKVTRTLRRGDIKVGPILSEQTSYIYIHTYHRIINLVPKLTSSWRVTAKLDQPGKDYGTEGLATEEGLRFSIRRIQDNQGLW